MEKGTNEFVIRIMTKEGKEYFGKPARTCESFIDPIPATVSKRCITDNHCIFNSKEEAEKWTIYEIRGMADADIDYMEVISVKDANYV